MEKFKAEQMLKSQPYSGEEGVTPKREAIGLNLLHNDSRRDATIAKSEALAEGIINCYLFFYYCY